MYLGKSRVGKITHFIVTSYKLQVISYKLHWLMYKELLTDLGINIKQRYGCYVGEKNMSQP